MSSFLWLGHGHVELCICLGVLGAWLTQHVCLPWGSEAAGGGGVLLSDGAVSAPLTCPQELPSWTWSRPLCQASHISWWRR